MSSEITTSKSFQERMYERIRDQMGDLMTEDELKRIVDAAVQKAFFEERATSDGYRTVKQEPFVVTMLRDMLREQMKSAIDAWLAEHQDAVGAAIKETLGKGITQIMQDHIDAKAQQPLWELQQRLLQTGVLR